MIGISAITELPITAVPASFLTTQQQSTVRYASHSFVTRSTDSPAHQFIPGRVARGVRLSRALTRTSEGAFGPLITTTFGEVELNNADGALDSLIDDFTADGRPIRLYIGATEVTGFGREQIQAFSDFVLVYSTVAGSWSLHHDVLKLRIRDLSVNLRNRLQPQTYSGVGGETGTAELAGRTMPTAIGRCNNVTAQLVDPFLLIYQVHAGAMDEFHNVYDTGVRIPTFAGDHPTYEALAAASLVAPPQAYATSLATGHLRLAAIPTGRITADVDGDLDNISGNVVTTHANIIRMILRDYGGIPSSKIDNASVNTMTGLQPSVCGIFLPAGDESTVEEVIAQFALSCGAFIGQDRSGLYRIQRLDPPAAAQNWSFDGRDIVAIEREEPDYSVPWKSWAVGYDVNWTVQDASELGVAVTTRSRGFLESERRYAIAQSSAIGLAHTTSIGSPPRPSLFADKASAEAEAARLLSFYGRGRALYRLVVKNVLFSVELGQTVRLTYPRWNLVNGKHFVVVGIDDDADRIETELLCFG